MSPTSLGDAATNNNGVSPPFAGPGPGSVNAMTSSPSARVGEGPSPLGVRPDRPCDGCRRRKSRCVINPDAASCVMCEFHKQACTFIEDAAPRRRKQHNNNTNNNNHVYNNHNTVTGGTVSSENASVASLARQRRS
ncbi:hypothetical protein AYO21_06568 [Fonsecaea monophora]|uniref:Zn(2)-C6 fungal-type domain-containing protein n=1 Tax=Fonsecaea monophora TaxID=254056 RepID=A0A177F4L6_9EURO|nr:hypothetical protein AYO21_06568 [Fonsecaea monophora]OAG39185.1 hypothetical protein AYO21_06568 [Fonsecaea monophora]